MPTPSKRRQKGPTPQEWKAIQPKFVRLYLQEVTQLSLAEIKETLAQEDGFHAEMHSYKLRVKQWDICPNLKASEKERIAREISSHLAQGLQVPPQLVHQRPVRLDKVVRHVRRCNRPAKADGDAEKNSLRLLSSGPSLSSEVLSTGTQQSARPNIRLPRPGFRMQLDPDETALHAVKDWHQWYFQTQPQPINVTEHDYATCVGATDDHFIHWDLHILAGLDSLNSGPRHDVYRDLDQGCTEFIRTLTSQPVHLVRDIVATFCFPDWRRCQDFKSCIQDYLYSMAKLKLGQQDPLVHFLRYLCRDHNTTSSNWGSMARALIRDLVDNFLEYFFTRKLQGFT